MKLQITRSKVFATLMVWALVLAINAVLSHSVAAAPLKRPLSSLPISAAAAPDPIAACKKDFIGLEPWYSYMGQEFVADAGSKCGYRVKCFNVFTQHDKNDCGETKSDIPGVLLALIDDLLRIAGLVAIAFVFVAAFRYIDSRGNSEQTAQAQTMIINAVVGLAISIAAVGFVAFLGNRLGG